MYGMRWLGGIIAAVMSIAIGLKLVGVFGTHTRLVIITLGIEIVNVGMLAAWILWVNEGAVRRGSDLYVDRICETLDTVAM